jgi:prolyl-tRNA synthetase
MRYSNLFTTTLHETPADVQFPGHRFLLRAGYIRQLAAGVYSLLPLAFRSLKKIETLVRQEITAIGGQEILMPVANPADLWKESGRWFNIDQELVRFIDRYGREMVLAMTHEEVVADLVRKLISSYRQLPAIIFHFQTKWRDDVRPRGGLIRAREFTMHDSYGLASSWDELYQQYRQHYQAYFNIFHRCGLEVMAVKADTGMMGGQFAHEFMLLSPVGEDTILTCDHCGYAANRQIAKFTKIARSTEPVKPILKVATPECKTIEDLASYLKVPVWKTAKAVFYIATPNGTVEADRFVFAVVRGDQEVNETKLANLLKASKLRPATEEEIEQTGAVAGYASPIGLKNVLVVIDDLIPQEHNLVAGANLVGYHYQNVNYERDFEADLIADISAAQAGDACSVCQSPLKAERAIELANTFALGNQYSLPFECTYQDAHGENRPILMSSYGIGMGRLLGAIAEIHFDSQGLCLPVTVAPFDIHLILLESRQNTEIRQQADLLYKGLTQAGVETLYDDRVESAGVKFADADLIGIPLRVTLSARSLKNGGVELKYRKTGALEHIPLDQTVPRLQEIIQALKHEIENRVVPVEYRQ